MASRFTRTLIVALALAAPAAFGACSPSASATDRPARVDGAQARRLVTAGAVLLDVRTPEEFRAGHIAGAINIPVDALAARTSELPRDRPVVVYCRSGKRSARAAAMLEGREVHDLGPMTAW